jgi:hypothetical protein
MISVERLKFSPFRRGGPAIVALSALLSAGAGGELRAQNRNDSAALFAAIAAHNHEAAGGGSALLVGDPRIWGIVPRRVIQSVVARLEARGIDTADCRLGCLEEPGDIHLNFGPIEFLPDGSVWVTVHSFGLLSADPPRRLWVDRTAYHAEYRNGAWAVVESRPAWTT